MKNFFKAWLTFSILSLFCLATNAVQSSPLQGKQETIFTPSVVDLTVISHQVAPVSLQVSELSGQPVLYSIQAVVQTDISIKADIVKDVSLWISRQVAQLSTLAFRTYDLEKPIPNSVPRNYWTPSRC